MQRAAGAAVNERTQIEGRAEAFAIDGPAIVDCVVAADELPNIPHVEIDLASHYAIAKIKEAMMAVTGR
jgi:pyruvate dehydrogenase (quinone)